MKKDKKEKITKDPSSEKVRRLPKFGIIDAVIILLIIAIAVSLAFRYNLFSTFVKLQEYKECAITFSVKDIENTTQFYINSGDAVYFKESGTPLGTIMESSEASSIPLTITPSNKTFIENGEVITVMYPPDTRIDAVGRIKCEGTFTDDGTFLLNGTEYISPGQTFTICTEKVTLQITVMSAKSLDN